MSFDFEKVLRKKESVMNFPITRWAFMWHIPFIYKKTTKKTLYYPELTIEESMETLKKYFMEDVTKEKLDQFPEKIIRKDLVKLYKKENKWFKEKDLRLDKVDLIVLIMDTVQVFVKKKAQEAEMGMDYRVQLYLESV